MLALRPAVPQNERYLERLRDLKDACGRNKHEQAAVLIEACIGDGITSRRGIVDVLGRMGFHHGHVVIVLNRRTGTIPGVHKWRRDETGRYALLTEVDRPAPIDASHIRS
jgi:hypothetical protein